MWIERPQFHLCAQPHSSVSTNGESFVGRSARATLIGQREVPATTFLTSLVHFDNVRDVVSDAPSPEIPRGISRRAHDHRQAGKIADVHVSWILLLRIAPCIAADRISSTDAHFAA
jgi:hypothetical protein